jgi:hypothetical protein
MVLSVPCDEISAISTSNLDNGFASFALTARSSLSCISSRVVERTNMFRRIYLLIEQLRHFAELREATTMAIVRDGAARDELI